MPRQHSASALSGALSKAIKKSRTEPVNYGQQFVDLPPGISGGVARLVEAKIGEYKQGATKGGKFLYMAGIVESPEKVSYVPEAFVNGKVALLDPKTVEVKGLRTSQTLPLCETPRASIDDNCDRAVNEVRKLGGEECLNGASNDADFEAVLKSIVEAKPRFRFGTRGSEVSQQYPNQRTWESWYGSNGLQQDGDSESSVDAVVEEPESHSDEDEEDDEDDVPFGDELDMLTDSAEKGDEEAANKLTQKAISAGYDDREIGDAPDWGTVAEMIRKPKTKPKADTEKEWRPEVGEVYGYKGVGMRSPAEHEVLTVDNNSETATLKNLDTGNTVLTRKTKLPLQISWEKLVEID